MMNQYDEIKSLLKRSRMLMEQTGPINMAQSIEDEIESDTQDTTEVDPEEVKKEKSKTYRISGGLLSLYSKDKKDLELTSEEKSAFQETMDDFVTEVSEIVDFNKLNLYSNNVEWSGKITELDVEFFYSIGETNGIYINGTMTKIDDDYLEFLNKLKQYYEKFKSKWSRVIASRKKTPES